MFGNFARVTATHSRQYRHLGTEVILVVVMSSGANACAANTPNLLEFVEKYHMPDSRGE